LAVPGADAQDNICLVRRGGPSGVFTPFALKAHVASRAGAKALLVINHSGQPLPNCRLGCGALSDELKVFWHTWNCGLPPIPVLLMPHEEGEQLREAVATAASTASVQAEFEVLPDTYPRRSLRRSVCQACALMLSGIGILYGVVQMFKVKVGDEFFAAETAATNIGVPCACIDVNLNQLWSRILAVLIPTPRNVVDAVLTWLAIHCCAFRFLFPAPGNLDALGSVALHAVSFPCRTWIAFVIAGFCASTVSTFVLQACTTEVTEAAVDTGAVTQSNEAYAQIWLTNILMLYAAPRLYDGILASRDEAMYCGIVEKAHAHNVQRIVAVTGAGHTNGILQRAKARGL